MSEDDRSRRRLGDATKARIEDLADGWSNGAPDPADSPPAPVADAPPPERKRSKTLPPPPPGSPARKAIEDAAVEVAAAARSKPTTAPPPARTKAASLPPPIATARPELVVPLDRPKRATDPPMIAPAVSSIPTPTAAAERSKPASLPPGSASLAPPMIAQGAAPLVAMPQATPAQAFPTPPLADRSKPASLPPADRSKPASLPPPSSSKASMDRSQAISIVPRSGPVTIPPPVPAERSKPASIPPPIPAAAARSKPTTIPPPIPPPLVVESASAPQGQATVIDASPPALDQTPLPKKRAETIPDSDVESLDDDDDESEHNLTVPRGEFDDGFHTIDDGKRRLAHEHATRTRDAAEALLKMPPPLPPPPAKPVPPPRAPTPDPEAEGVVRGDPTAVDPAFAQGDASASIHVRGRIRSAAKLRRKRGLAGDVFYVFTALFGVRRSRRELADLEVRMQTRSASRKRHLITLGRTAIIADAFSHPALTAAGQQLDGVEDERSQHAGQVAAADGELDRVRREREAAGASHSAAMSAIESELAELAKKLEPLEKDAAVVQKRADGLRESIARIDREIVSTESSLVSVKGPKTDVAAVQAEIATLRADRKSVERDEPVIAAELDTLNPRIAAIKGARTAASERRTKLDADEVADKRRAAELVEAIKAKRKVVDRAVADAESTRDAILLDLGERLYLDRPSKLTAQLAPIDEIDLELGESERRAEELREILSNVDRAKLARGAAVIALVVLALGAGATWVAYAAY
nr:hypothetical protein [Kofleriaceae bacterium]